MWHANALPALIVHAAVLLPALILLRPPSYPLTLSSAPSQHHPTPQYLYVCMYVCTCTKHLIVCVGRENNVGRQDREHGVMCARTRVRVCAVGRRVCTWIRAHTMFRFLRAQVLEKIWREWVSEQDVEKVPAL